MQPAMKPVDPDEINLLDCWYVVKRYIKMIAIILASVSVAAVIISLLLPKSFKATAQIIPISGGGGSNLSTLSSQLSGLAALVGGGNAGDLGKLTTILNSRTLIENVINREHLMQVLYEDNPEKQPTMEDGVNKLKGLVTVVEDQKTQSIQIEGVFRDPQLAAKIVNAYLDELQKFINENTLTMAKRNRIFVEDQLEQNKIDLLESGKEINEFYKGSRVSTTESKMDVPIAQQVAKSRDFLTFTEQSPDFSNLIAQKKEVEDKITEAKVVKDVPQQVYLTYLMMRRELLAKINGFLATQYEMAKIDEANEDLTFQVIDYAVPPVMRCSPKRAQICIVSFMAALFFSIFLAFFLEYIKKMKEMQI